ncbi:S-adenosyl-L-methionine-dependent methyltransferase [Obba rivulosa]|uniref:S-adenosyl-L-methionine-dependent methyltransferase n=1 Tax=Obba rivulosa TaxID=1052685 RepID=A0A8E2DI74_9APHY|nr:S-adenosyl-L-methionine-dependent methyltransferase [Obba rivulosa]
MTVPAPPDPGALARYDVDDPEISIASDASSELVEIDPEEYRAYFREDFGRLFHAVSHSHGNLPYPLPVDGVEQQRLKDLHSLLRRLFGNNYVGPVQEILAPTRGRVRRAVDFGTGTGLWPMEMAEEFPHVRFDGLDKVPIQTRHPLRNVMFEIHDIAERTRYQNGAIDLVHARFLTMAVRNYRQLVREAARILRSDGLFIACEWHEYPVMNDGSDPIILAPASCNFFHAVAEGVTFSGVNWVASSIPEYLAETHLFKDIEVRVFKVPVGNWHQEQVDIGVDFADTLKTYANSARYMLYETGRNETQVNDLINTFTYEIESSPGIVCLLYTVHARRV